MYPQYNNNMIKKKINSYLVKVHVTTAQIVEEKKMSIEVALCELEVWLELCKHKSLSSNPSHTKKKKRIYVKSLHLKR
jgi:hypothetical protein